MPIPAAEFLITARDKTRAVIEGVKGRLQVLTRVARGFATAFSFGLSAAVGGAALRLKAFTEEADRLAKTGRKLGLTVEQLQKLEYAGRLSAVSQETLAKAIERSQSAVADAEQGLSTATDALGRLNLTAADLINLSPHEQFLKIGDALSKVANQSQRIDIARDIFGGRASDVLRLFENGAAGLKAMADEFERLGAGITQEQAKAAERYNDSLERLSSALKKLENATLGPIVEELAEFLDNIGYGNPIIKLHDDIQDLRQEIKELENISPFGRLLDGILGVTNTERLNRLEALKQQLAGLRKEQAKLIEAQEQAEARAGRAEGLTAMSKRAEAAREQGTKQLKAQLKEREAAYKDHIRNLREFEKDQADIAREFAALIEEMRGATAAAPDLIDVSNARLQAQQALIQGDLDGAIEKARQAAELLRALKDSGDESSIVLTGVAKGIERIANEAAKRKTDTEIINAQQAEQDIDRIKQKLDALPGFRFSFEQGSVESEINRLSQFIGQRIITVPVQLVPINDPTGGGGGGISETVARAVAQQGGK